MARHQLERHEVEAIEAVGEYLGAFLALENDWGVIDGLKDAPSPEAATYYYLEALKRIHNVMARLEEKGAGLPEDFSRHSKTVFQGLQDAGRFRLFCLRLVERALTRYPEYYRLLRAQD